MAKLTEVGPILNRLQDVIADIHNDHEKNNVKMDPQVELLFWALLYIVATGDRGEPFLTAILDKIIELGKNQDIRISSNSLQKLFTD